MDRGTDHLPDERTTGAGAVLADREVALVLRRAAELELAEGGPGRGVEVAAVEEAAVEAGLSLSSVRTALAELRVGALEPAPPRPRRLVGPGRLAVHRVVPGPEWRVTAMVRAFLDKELFKLRRHRGGQASFVQRADLAASLRRGIDRGVSKRLGLTEVRAVEVAIAGLPGAGEGGPGRVMVKMEADLSRLCRQRGAAVAAGGAVGAAWTAGTIAVAAAAGPLALVALPLGAGAAAVGWQAGVSSYRRRVDDVEAALEAFLDRLEGLAS